MRERPIIVSERDALRLRGLLGRQSEASLRDQEHLRGLKAELERALVLQVEEVPGDVVMMNSHVHVLDLKDGKRSDYVLVFPLEADVTAGRVSVLAPMGTALLGFREGDDVEWMMPGGVRELHIERVVQESAGTHGRRIA